MWTVTRSASPSEEPGTEARGAPESPAPAGRGLHWQADPHPRAARGLTASSPALPARAGSVTAVSLPVPPCPPRPPAPPARAAGAARSRRAPRAAVLYK